MTRYCILSHTCLPFGFSAQIVVQRLQILHDVMFNVELPVFLSVDVNIIFII